MVEVCFVESQDIELTKLAVTHQNLSKELKSLVYHEEV